MPTFLSPTRHLPHLVCPACESLELGVDQLLQKIAITIPRGVSSPSELLGHMQRNVQTFRTWSLLPPQMHKTISRVVALFPASLSLQAQKPCATGTKHQLLELPFLSPALPTPLPIISVLPLCSPAPHFIGLIFTNFQRKCTVWISIRKGSKASKLPRCHKFHECGSG